MPALAASVEGGLSQHRIGLGGPCQYFVQTNGLARAIPALKASVQELGLAQAERPVGMPVGHNGNDQVLGPYATLGL